MPISRNNRPISPLSLQPSRIRTLAPGRNSKVASLVALADTLRRGGEATARPATPLPRSPGSRIEILAPGRVESPRPAALVDSRLVCPLSGERLSEPVIAPDGRTYSKKPLLTHLALNNNELPSSRITALPQFVIPNRHVAGMLEGERSLHDPIMETPISDPLVADDGYTYDRKTIKSLCYKDGILQLPISPFTRKPLNFFIPNSVLKKGEPLEGNQIITIDRFIRGLPAVERSRERGVSPAGQIRLDPHLVRSRDNGVVIGSVSGFVLGAGGVGAVAALALGSVSAVFTGAMVGGFMGMALGAGLGFLFSTMAGWLRTRISGGTQVNQANDNDGHSI